MSPIGKPFFTVRGTAFFIASENSGNWCFPVVQLFFTGPENSTLRVVFHSSGMAVLQSGNRALSQSGNSIAAQSSMIFAVSHSGNLAFAQSSGSSHSGSPVSPQSCNRDSSQPEGTPRLPCPSLSSRCIVPTLSFVLYPSFHPSPCGLRSLQVAFWL